MEYLRVREHREHGAIVLTVSGELDVATGPQLDRELAALATAGEHRVVLACAGLTFCDACGITVLLRARSRAHDHQGWLRLAAAHPRLRHVLTITALTRVLLMFDTVADAVAGPNPPAAPTASSRPAVTAS